MVDRDVALEALSALCNATVTSVQKQAAEQQAGVKGAWNYGEPEQLNIRTLVHTVLTGEASCLKSGPVFQGIQSGGQAKDHVQPRRKKKFHMPFKFHRPFNYKLRQTASSFLLEKDIYEELPGKLYIIDEDEFFDPMYHFDFTNVKDSQTYSRGGETYERPCGWYRLGLKVLDQYGENTWLGNTNRSTQSVEGEWPVSYHGTSQGGAEGIIKRRYEPGQRAAYGHGVYSTPDLSVAGWYAKSFKSQKTGKTYNVILQNRINPEHREKCLYDKYWLVRVPRDASDEKEEELVERAIRPYGLLLKEV
ncbi:uncharacterized protein LOC113133583 [Mastacembelus armatus]|uniref:uncharacterized protein LOC113133583 n=1 Tax=Mastacembelus armatus TaxID=205130 RepID=UPI000E45F052|nr:uncharacterized protein LOC113133583 [Mastacembelus armatus]